MVLKLRNKLRVIDLAFTRFYYTKCMNDQDGKEKSIRFRLADDFNLKLRCQKCMTSFEIIWEVMEWGNKPYLVKRTSCRRPKLTWTKRGGLRRKIRTVASDWDPAGTILHVDYLLACHDLIRGSYCILSSPYLLGVLIFSRRPSVSDWLFAMGYNGSFILDSWLSLFFSIPYL